MAKHAFGGIWTEAKLKVLGEYLKPFTQALGPTFTLHYCDAFAGTGSRSTKQDDSQASLIPIEDMKGSVQIALDTDGFDHYHFNDINPEHCLALKEIRDRNPGKSINVTCTDANDFVMEFCKKLAWNDRVVLFIDPYATELKWETLKAIAATGKIDLWLLFPFADFSRLIPKSGANPQWEKKITSMLGDSDWKLNAYRESETPATPDLFGEESESKEQRVDQGALQQYITERLSKIFTYTSQPLPLKNSKNSTLFLLYFSVSNKSGKAIGLAKRISNSILKKPLLR